MNARKTAALGAALVATAVFGFIFAPVIHGQARVRPAVGAVQLLPGGSHIGLSIRDVDDAAAAKGTQGRGGAVVEEVAPGGPAAEAGLRKADVILEFDGERVRSARQLTRLVQETPANRTVEVIVLREGQRTTLSLTPRERAWPGARGENLDESGERARRLRMRIRPAPPVPAVPPAPPAPMAPPAPPAPSDWAFDDPVGRTGRLGATVRALSSQLADYFGVANGVLVASVAEESAAAKAGLKAGDVITAIDGVTIEDPADVRRQVQRARDGDELSIAVTRERKPLTLTVRVAARGERPSVRL